MEKSANKDTNVQIIQVNLYVGRERTEQISFNLNKYKDLISDVDNKSQEFRNKLSEKDPTTKSLVLINPFTGVIKFTDFECRKYIAKANFMFIARSIQMGLETVWEWAFNNPIFGPHYRDIEMILPLIPEELKSSKNDGFTVDNIVIQTLLGIIAKEMKFECIYSNYLGHEELIYHFGLTNVEFIDIPVEEADRQVILKQHASSSQK